MKCEVGRGKGEGALPYSYSAKRYTYPYTAFPGDTLGPLVDEYGYGYGYEHGRAEEGNHEGGHV